MQPYNTFQDVIKLALKIEALNKYRSSTTIGSVAREGFAKDLTSMDPSDAKTTPKPQVKSEVHKQQQESTSKSKRCYKYQWFRHIAFECPIQNVVALTEEDKAKEENVDEVVKSNYVQRDEENSSLLSKSELDVEEVVESNHV